MSTAFICLESVDDLLGLLSLINFSEGMLHMMEYSCVDLDLTKENAEVTINCTTIASRFTISWFRW